MLHSGEVYIFYINPASLKGRMCVFFFWLAYTCFPARHISQQWEVLDSAHLESVHDVHVNVGCF